MTLRCERVREALLVLPVAEFDDLAAHLARCPACADAADRIRCAEAEIGRALDDFAEQALLPADLDAAFARAPRPRWRLPWSPTTMLTVAAAVVATALALAPGLSDEDEPEAPEPAVLSPAPAPAPTPPEPAPAPAPAPEPTGTADAAPTSPPAAPRAAPRRPERRASSGPPPAPSCGDLSDKDVQRELRSPAYGGNLTPDQVACLEAGYAAGGDTREALSKILLEQAWVVDKPHFEQLALRHLDEVGTDLKTLYRLVIYWGEQKPRRSAEISRWAPVALDLREEWLVDPMYGHHVNMMCQHLTYARIELWQAAVAKNRRTPSPEAAAEAEAARVALLAAAKEWLVSGKQTGLHTRQIAQYCRSAGGTPEECAE